MTPSQPLDPPSRRLLSCSRVILACCLVSLFFFSACQPTDLPAPSASTAVWTPTPTANLRPRLFLATPTLPAPAAAETTPAMPATAAVGTTPAMDAAGYLSQPGDTLANLAGRFSITPAELLRLNPALQKWPSYFPPGTPIQIPPDPGSHFEPYQALLPDNLYVNGPSENGFKPAAFIKQSNGWIGKYVDNSSGNNVTGYDILVDIASTYSISPRLLLALLEIQLHALSDPNFPASYSLGNPDPIRKAFTSQISWMANTLNNGFYRWQDGKAQIFRDSGLNFDPRQDSATVALQYYFSQVKPAAPSRTAGQMAQEFLAVYQSYFGAVDWNSPDALNLLPPGLSQPDLSLPFSHNDQKWSFSGGPHAGWGSGDPLAAVDFAPPTVISGCDPSPLWALAVTDGVIARAEDGLVLFDLSGDLNPRTGWVIQYMHLFPQSVPPVGTALKQGERIGHPSCVGGHATGRHVHLARLYNGVWISAADPLPFTLSGWVVSAGAQEYDGTLTRNGIVVQSDVYGEHQSLIAADPPK